MDIIDVDGVDGRAVVTVQRRNDPRDEAEHEYAYDVWAFDASQNLKKTAEITSIPYNTLWRWHKSYDWRGRWDREWGEITAPARRGAAVKVAARVDEIVDAVVDTAVDRAHPSHIPAARLALELMTNLGGTETKSGVSVQILQQFGGMSEAEMKARVGAALADNMSTHQVERSKKKG